ncbi:unnamed protein product [Nesidiocoris tenuis]|uniref:Uncharacterized protein n=1 Tax=Nesidiocoris tenuis TaxID=355587 RepID=A0A6H5G866_9HEMI|nr:unnamed protein product [Nesidiocoris tenuis]
MFGYPASANRLFAASVFRRLPSGSVASRSPRCTDIYVSCCGNILWFEKCNTSEYAAGGHRPTRSDAAKPPSPGGRNWAISNNFWPVANLDAPFVSIYEFESPVGTALADPGNGCDESGACLDMFSGKQPSDALPDDLGDATCDALPVVL